MMMTDRWKGVEMVVYRRRKNRIGQVLGALWIFIMTLVDMFTSICGHHFSVFVRWICDLSAYVSNANA